MVLTERDDIRTVETDDEILIFDVSDDTLERAASVGTKRRNVEFRDCHRWQLRLPLH